MNQTSVFASMLIAVSLLIGIASTASAYYDPEQGRFISRDPINTVNQPNMAVAHSSNVIAAYPRIGQISTVVQSGPIRVGSGVAAPQPKGRTIKRDPIKATSYADGMNLYTYVGNSPANYVDPSGMLRTKKCDSKQKQELEDAAKEIEDNLDKIKDDKVRECVQDRLDNAAVICGGLWCCKPGAHGYQRLWYKNVHICPLAFDQADRSYPLKYTLLHEWIHSCGIDADEDNTPEDDVFPDFGWGE